MANLHDSIHAGDDVTFNSQSKPTSFVGLVGSVLSINSHHAVVEIHRACDKHDQFDQIEAPVSWFNLA